MGDHRASVKIEFTFHGKTETYGGWINWAPWAESAECEGVDNRIVEFFRNATHEGMARYEERMAEYHAESRKAETEKREREELERLKAKYEAPRAGGRL